MRKKVLICDLDNTLYDWVLYFVPSFYAMVDKAVELTGWDREKLLDDFRTVHQQHHDSEHPFALLETNLVKQNFAGQSMRQVMDYFDPAFHAFNSTRKKRLALYPTVRESLASLRKKNVTLVAYTDSKLYSVVDRLARLELASEFSAIFCRTRSLGPHPRMMDNWLPKEIMARVYELSHHQRKPDASVLREIAKTVSTHPSEIAYIGDSLVRDVLMANRADIFGIWAAYGTKHDANIYRQLVRVSHWTAEDVEREKDFIEDASKAKPDLIAEKTFSEVLTASLF